MKKLTLADFKGNDSRYNFYLEAHNILNAMENMNESRTINEDVSGAAAAQIKPFFDDLLLAIKRMKGEINENTSVNMNPYKEAIQNAETPKQKSAKNKISDLSRK